MVKNVLDLSTEVLLPYSVRPKTAAPRLFGRIPARRHQFGVADAIAAETAWERRD